MMRNNEFTIAREFNSNWYGFPKNMMIPTDKHIITNVWPYLLPELVSLHSVLFVGLDVPSAQIALLRARMIARGDSKSVVEERMRNVKVDLADLKKVSKVISRHGQMFTVHDDTVIPEEVIPWIVRAGGL